MLGKKSAVYRGMKARKAAPRDVGGVRHGELAVVVAARVMAEPRNPERFR